MTTDEQPPERYAVVALMGHRQVAGRVSEEMFAGTPMCRVDIPLADGSFSTRLFGGSAIYEITFVEEDVARAVAKRDPAHPVSAWSARSLGLLPEPEREELMVDESAFLAEGEEDGLTTDEVMALVTGASERDDAIPPLDDARVEDGDVSHGSVEEAMAADRASEYPF